ncbi:hypothetical protein GOP47_0001475 [Adiantum capillus-veneris]|uniref:GH16 domain-containing protein n=1 Tax=Adiantum capillus-veneris TaxID=13818 RepID=A0A9D4VA51_ADICA|nr:hypothetical protein GOP47_0001475 [Adiantum capillus-veneris]
MVFREFGVLCDGENMQKGEVTAASMAAAAALSSSLYRVPAYRGRYKAQRFSSAFANLWSPDHQRVSSDDLYVTLNLDHHSGIGFKSKSSYQYGLFSAAIKLPTNNSAGVAITFYTSNNGIYKHNHDEIDFEFLGVLPGEPFVVQTNVYGNGSTSIGREQRFHLWFDPTIDFHHYSILWTPNHIVFSIDGVPIREMKNSKELGVQYPSKPMSVYGTIWDASTWATEGGKYKIDFRFSPFSATYKDLVLHGCMQGPHSYVEENIGDLDMEEIYSNCNLQDSTNDSPIFDNFLTYDQEMGLQWKSVGHTLSGKGSSGGTM